MAENLEKPRRDSWNRKESRDSKRSKHHRDYIQSGKEFQVIYLANFFPRNAERHNEKKMELSWNNRHQFNQFTYQDTLNSVSTYKRKKKRKKKEKERKWELVQHDRMQKYKTGSSFLPRVEHLQRLVHFPKLLIDIIQSLKSTENNILIRSWRYIYAEVCQRIRDLWFQVQR